METKRGSSCVLGQHCSLPGVAQSPGVSEAPPGTSLCFHCCCLVVLRFPLQIWKLQQCFSIALLWTGVRLKLVYFDVASVTPKLEIWWSLKCVVPSWWKWEKKPARHRWMFPWSSLQLQRWKRFLSGTAFESLLGCGALWLCLQKSTENSQGRGTALSIRILLSSKGISYIPCMSPAFNAPPEVSSSSQSNLCIPLFRLILFSVIKLLCYF